MRPAATLSALPDAAYSVDVDAGAGKQRAARSRCCAMPTNTPVGAPARRVGRDARRARAPPRRPRAAGAAAGPLPSPRAARCRRSAASNRSTPSRKPPRRVYIFPGASGSRIVEASTSQRSRGTSATASTPSRSRRQNASGSRRRPGSGSPCRRWRSARRPGAPPRSSCACSSRTSSSARLPATGSAASALATDRLLAVQLQLGQSVRSASSSERAARSRVPGGAACHRGRGRLPSSSAEHLLPGMSASASSVG